MAEYSNSVFPTKPSPRHGLLTLAELSANSANGLALNLFQRTGDYSFRAAFNQMSTHRDAYQSPGATISIMSFAVAARGCLPSGENVCVAAPVNQSSSAIRILFQDFGHRSVNQLLGSPPLSSLFIPSPSLSSPHLTCHSPHFSLPSPKSRPFKFS